MKSLPIQYFALHDPPCRYCRSLSLRSYSRQLVPIHTSTAITLQSEPLPSGEIQSHTAYSSVDKSVITSSILAACFSNPAYVDSLFFQKFNAFAAAVRT